MTEVQCTERLVSKEILFLAQNIHLHPSSVDLRVNAQRPLTVHNIINGYRVKWYIAHRYT